MKRLKKVKPTISTFKQEKMEYKCPHCKTTIVDYSLSRDVIRINCSHCKNPIEFIWEEGKC